MGVEAVVATLHLLGHPMETSHFFLGIAAHVR